MSQQENIASVQALYEAFGRGDVDIWRFRDGKIDCYRGSEDTALTAEVLGLEVASAV